MGGITTSGEGKREELEDAKTLGWEREEMK